MKLIRWHLVLVLQMLLVGKALSITVPIPEGDAGTHTSVVNPNATAEAKGLMRFLSSIYGKNVLSGHQLSYNIQTGNDELAKIKGWTGQTPAVRGFDFMDVINGYGAKNAEEGLKWGQTGGIVTLAWHWRLGGADFYSPAYHGGGTSFPGGDPATNGTINADLKKLGDELQKFADAKIPVLWRPLHEPPGNWFWWHTAGPDQYKKLWIHMYNYLVNTRKLNNLIWVYSSSDGGTANTAWYPGNQYVDIIGVDRYGGDFGTFFNNLKGMSNNQRMAAVTENKQFPDWNTSYPYLWTLCWNNEIFNSMGQGDFQGHYNNPHTINYGGLPTVTNKVTWDKMNGAPGPKVVSQPKDIRVVAGTTSLSGVLDLAQVFLDATDGTNLVWGVKVEGAAGILAKVGAAGKVDLTFSDAASARATVTVTGTNKSGGVGAASFDVVVRSFAGNLALNQPVTVSSSDAYSQGEAAVTDGSVTTRWSSAYKDGESVTVDLDTALAIDNVVLNWEDAYASSYEISVSVDSTKWTVVKSVSNGAGGKESVTFPSTKARWVRLTGTTRATAYGISLWELEVYGKPVPDPTALISGGRLRSMSGDRIAVFSIDGRPIQVLGGVEARAYRATGMLPGLRTGMYLVVDGGQSSKVIVGN
jgi:mannan endo-1,4-beta-mannosidase